MSEFYGLVHIEDKTKTLAKDHWGRTIAFDSAEEAIKFLKETNENNFQVKLVKKAKPKNPGDEYSLTESYFRNSR